LLGCSHGDSKSYPGTIAKLSDFIVPMNIISFLCT